MNELIKRWATDVREGDTTVILASEMMDDRELAISVYGEFAMLMNQVSKMAYLDGDMAKRELSKITTPPGMEYLRDAIFSHVCIATQSKAVKEKDVVSWFFSNLQIFIPGANRKSLHIDQSHIPDGFVEVNGEVMPVEVKLDSFTKSSLSQLNRYICRYGARGGVAVARELRCSLPENIMFIRVPKGELK